MTDSSSPRAEARSLGARLRSGREALQFSTSDVASKLRVSQAIVEAIERDDLERLGAPVYARGYLNSYARLVGMPLVVVNSTFDNSVEPLPPLHSATHTSYGRLLVDRYARRAASIVLTASIVVPVVWLATEERLPVQPVALRSLDLQTPDAIVSQGQQAQTTLPSGSFVGPPEMLAGPAPRRDSESDDVPVMASFAPFLNARSATPAKPLVADATGWTLLFRGDSWVEIVDHDGKRLEYGVIRSGRELRYPADSVARVSLGNASVVDVFRDGQSMSLAPFQRANVARFAVSSAGELTPAGG